jgi:inosine/xanthosine triphosphatase
MTVLTRLRLVAVGSTNPVKIAAVRAVLTPLAPQVRVEGVAADSTVSAQPWGDEETIRGARARAIAARRALDAELGVGIEGGVVESGGALRTCAWAAVAGRSGAADVVGVGGSLAMPLPPAVAAAVLGGAELGEAIDRLTRTVGSKRGRGAVGVLTDGLIDRQRAYEVILTYALAPLLTPEYWGDAPVGDRPD